MLFGVNQGRLLWPSRCEAYYAHFTRVCARGSISCPYMRTPVDPLETVNEALFYSCHDDQMPMIALQVASDLWQLCMPNIVIASVVFTCPGNLIIISVSRTHAFCTIAVKGSS